MTFLQSEALRFGAEPNVIRDIAGFAAGRAAEIGKENVFNFSIGNPNVPAPKALTEKLKELLETIPPEELHAYSPAPGYGWVRKAVAEDLNRRYGTDYGENDKNIIN